LPFSLETLWGIKHGVQGFFRINGLQLPDELISHRTALFGDGVKPSIAY
jgi:hypothetical protein